MELCHYLYVCPSADADPGEAVCAHRARGLYALVPRRGLCPLEGEAEGLFVEKKNVFKCGVLSLNRVAWKGGFWTGGTTSPVLSPCLPPGIRHRMTGPGGA